MAYLADGIDMSIAAGQAGNAVPAGRAADALTLSVTVAGRLARLMGGELRAERLNGTSVAVVSLPANTERLDAESQTSGIVATFAPRGADGSATVLVIDDDAATLDLVRRWMNARGMKVLTASNGEEGLELARLYRPDYVILDIFMPGRSGYEVLAELRKDPDLAGTPVVVISSDDNRRLGLEAGAAEVLVKPLSRERLGATLDVLREQVSGDILVVDDDADVREIVHRYAARAGLEVRLASNGQEGIAQAREKKPGAIVLDLRMPGGNGFEMLDQLMDDGNLRDVPVMVLSQLDLSVAQHMRLRDAGHAFHPKWRSSPLQIVQNIKTMVAR